MILFGFLQTKFQVNQDFINKSNAKSLNVSLLFAITPKTRISMHLFIKLY